MSTPGPAPSRRDRSSRVLAVIILAAIVVPVVWLVVVTALGGREAVELERPGTSEIPRLTTVPTPTPPAGP